MMRNLKLYRMIHGGAWLRTTHSGWVPIADDTFFREVKRGRNDCELWLPGDSVLAAGATVVVVTLVVMLVSISAGILFL